MHAHQCYENSGDDPNVCGEEALQGECAELRSAAEGFEDELAEEGNCASDLCADGGCPVGFLIPREQVTCEAHAQRREEEADADEPCEFTRELERGGEEHAQHVDEDDDHHQGCTPVMNAAN